MPKEKGMPRNSMVRWKNVGMNMDGWTRLGNAGWG